MKSAGPLPAGVASHLPPIRNIPPDMLECAYTQHARPYVTLLVRTRTHQGIALGARGEGVTYDLSAT